MASVLVEGLSLFRDMESIGLPVTDLMDLGTEGIPDFLPERLVDTHGLFHGLLGLVLIGKSLSSHQGSNGHQGSNESATRLSMAGYPSREGAAGSKHILTDHADLLLQSRKNSLCSAMVGHLVLKGCFVNLLKQFLLIFHLFLSRSG